VIKKFSLCNLTRRKEAIRTSRAHEHRGDEGRERSNGAERASRKASKNQKEFTHCLPSDIRENATHAYVTHEETMPPTSSASFSTARSFDEMIARGWNLR